VADFKERKPRAFDEIRTLEDIIEMLKTQFHNRKLNIKYSIDRIEARVNEYLEDNTVMLVTDQEYAPEDTITVYGLLDKYFEIDMKVVETRGPGYFQCRIVSMRKASRGRRDLHEVRQQGRPARRRDGTGDSLPSGDLQPEDGPPHRLLREGGAVEEFHLAVERRHGRGGEGGIEVKGIGYRNEG